MSDQEEEEEQQQQQQQVPFQLLNNWHDIFFVDDKFKKGDKSGTKTVSADVVGIKCKLCLVCKWIGVGKARAVAPRRAGDGGDQAPPQTGSAESVYAPNFFDYTKNMRLVLEPNTAQNLLRHLHFHGACP
jgi:hypothetical protein